MQKTRRTFLAYCPLLLALFAQPTLPALLSRPPRTKTRKPRAQSHVFRWIGGYRNNWNDPRCWTSKTADGPPGKHDVVLFLRGACVVSGPVECADLTVGFFNDFREAGRARLLFRKKCDLTVHGTMTLGRTGEIYGATLVLPFAFAG